MPKEEWFNDKQYYKVIIVRGANCLYYITQ